MKLKKMSAACALAVASMSGNAFALTAFETPDLTVYLSGATAPDNFLASIANGMFDAGQGIFRFQDNNGTTSTSQFNDDGRGWNAFYGVMKNTTDIPANLQAKKVMFVKRSAGGSVWGVDPVARGTRHRTIEITSSCVLNTTGVTSYRCPIIGIDPGQIGYLGTNPGVISDFGVSDVEPAMFKGPYNVEFGQSQLSTSETGRMNVFPVNALMMGIVATAAVPATTYISRQDYGSMLSGSVQDWSQIDPTISAGNTQVVICRRVQGSGTQTSYNWFFNNFPCQAGFGGTVAPARMLDNSAGVDLAHAGTASDPILINPVSGFTVVENSGSGNVRDCLVAAQNHTNHQFTGDDGKVYRIQFANSANPFRAIGTLSVDSYTATSSVMDPTGATNWAFRMLDGAGIYNPTTQSVSAGPGTGVAPSKANLGTGKYDFVVELTMQYRNSSVTSPVILNPHGDVITALSGLKLEFADLFIARAGDPAFNALNATSALPPNYIPTLDANGVPTNNVTRGTRTGNTCSPWQKLI